ncbi:MAG TPA: nicotinamidase [Steroidobacteraceae bacterium]
MRADFGPGATLYSATGPSERDVATEIDIAPADALLVVDLQVDFLPGGALAVPDGDAVVAPLNRCIDAFARSARPVLYSRDWHPERHCSFRSQGGPWPAHCIAGTRGARFAPALHVIGSARVISKATSEQRDAYSAFQETGLASELRALGVGRLFIGGLATDYCVRATALDARAEGFEVVVLTDAVRAVDVRAGDGERALEEMRAAGARLIDSSALREPEKAA